MPLSEWELWACANRVLESHGERAPNHVAEQIGVLVLRDDVAGIQTWREIARRIAELTRASPEAGDLSRASEQRPRFRSRTA